MTSSGDVNGMQLGIQEKPVSTAVVVYPCRICRIVGEQLLAWHLTEAWIAVDKTVEYYTFCHSNQYYKPEQQ
jgi:hypothetical protein